MVVGGGSAAGSAMGGAAPVAGAGSAGLGLGASAGSGVGAGTANIAATNPGASPSVAGGLTSSFYAPGMSASETDGETFDGDADFDEDDEWDYNEILSNLSKSMKTYILQPLVVGAAAAFGMSIGYAMFDATTSLFTRKPRTR